MATDILNLYQPAAGEIGWDDEVNANFDTIDALFGGNSSSGTHSHSGVSGQGATISLPTCGGTLTAAQTPTTATIATIVATFINSSGNKITFGKTIDLYTKSMYGSFFQVMTQNFGAIGDTKISLLADLDGYNYGYDGSFATVMTPVINPVSGSIVFGGHISAYGYNGTFTRAIIGSFHALNNDRIVLENDITGYDSNVNGSFYDALIYNLQAVYGQIITATFGTIQNLPLGTMVKPIYMSYGIATMGTTGASVMAEIPLFTIKPNSNLGMVAFRFYHDLSYSTYVVNVRSYTDFTSEPAVACVLELDGTTQQVSMGADSYMNYELRFPWAKGTAGFYEGLIRGTADSEGTLYIQGLQLSAYRYA